METAESTQQATELIARIKNLDPERDPAEKVVWDSRIGPEYQVWLTPRILVFASPPTPGGWGNEAGAVAGVEIDGEIVQSFGYPNGERIHGALAEQYFNQTERHFTEPDEAEIAKTAVSFDAMLSEVDQVQASRGAPSLE